MMRRCLIAFFIFAWALPTLADAPVAGDVIVMETGSCAVYHLDPTTSISHVISQWGCFGVGGSIVGTGPTNWDWFDGNEDLIIQPDGWMYLLGRTGGVNFGVYRIHPATGNRELVTTIPNDANAFTLWPESSFFTPPAVAALSVGATVLLGVVLIGLSKRKGQA